MAIYLHHTLKLSGTMKPLQNTRSFCGAPHPEPFQFPEPLGKTATL